MKIKTVRNIKMRIFAFIFILTTILNPSLYSNTVLADTQSAVISYSFDRVSNGMVLNDSSGSFNAKINGNVILTS